jgi:hypothetical protein
VSRFTRHLGLRLLEYSNGRPVTRGDGCLWYLPEELPWEVGAEGSGVLLTVPAFDPAEWTDKDLRAVARRELRPRGVTDLTSVPWIGRRLIRPDGPYVKGAVLHDDGYLTRGWYGEYSRKQVDDVLNETLEHLGVAVWKRAVIYSAVRVGGGSGWGS